MLSSSNAAEYGGSAGGIIVATTKSGANKFHGSVYEYDRNDLFDAPGFFAPVRDGAKVKPVLRYNVFGGTLGGPIIRDKTFFFFAYEGQRLRTGGVDTLTVPTALQRAGDFSQTFNAQGAVIRIFDPASTRTVSGVVTRDQYPDNRIPASQLDPIAARLMQFYPQPNRAPDNITGIVVDVVGDGTDVLPVTDDEVRETTVGPDKSETDLYENEGPTAPDVLG